MNRRLLVGAAAIAAVMIYFVALLWWLGIYNFAYQEHLTTMYYDGYRALRVFNVPGGCVKILADCLIQYFVHPWAGVLITAALLTLISIFTVRVTKIVYGNNLLAPIALLPATVLAFLHYNVNYMYSGTVALLLMLVVLNGMFNSDGKLRYRNIRYRIAYGLIATVVLYTLAGAVAALYAVTMVILAVFKNPRQSANFLLLPLFVVILGYISMRVGQISDQRHVLLPEAYFVHRLPAPSMVYAPWLTFLGVVTFSCMMSLYRMRSLWLRRVVQGVLILIVVVTASVLTRGHNWDTETYKRLSCMMRAQQWEQITADPAAREATNLLLLNCLNVAQAETGMLADSLSQQPCVDIRNIYIAQESNPMNYMTLSDIYWSMGHIALARRYAFEANESLDDSSPRMLQRLVDTNIVYGDYKVAEKYLDMLERTLYYRDWAAQRRGLCSDAAVQADSLLNLKRKCLNTENSFSSLRGLDRDLLDILRTNPEHRPTKEFLDALYRLSNNKKAYDAFIEEFGTENPNR